MGKAKIRLSEKFLTLIMEKEFQKILSERNKVKLIFQNNEYNFYNENDSNEIYRCVNRKCKGRVSLFKETQKITIIYTHDHLPPVSKIKKLLYYQEIKKYSEVTSYSASKIYELITAPLSKVDSLIITKKNAYKLVESTRKKILKNENFLIDGLPSYLLQTQREENFLLEKIDEPNLKYLILATESNMGHLNDSNIWIADGTFRSCPSEYKQLYVIFASVMGIFVPVVYALLDGKTISHYDKLFIILKKYLKNEVPRTIIVDNEQAVQTSFLKNFPNGRVYLCFFHFSQSIFRNIQKNGLVGEYLKKKKLYNGISMLRSLIFVTPKNLLLEYEKVKNYLLVNNSNQDKYISRFLKYFEDNYILSLKQTFKRLNVIDRLKEDIPLTTNYAESFNRTLNSRLDKEHPNICVFLKVIRSMQHETEKKILSSLMSPDQTYYDLSDFGLRKTKLLEIIENYDKYNGLNYLETISSINNNFSEQIESEIIHETDF